jgi:hypothetical protein
MKAFNNITHADKLAEDTIEVADRMIEILSQIAGPFATNAILGSPTRQRNDVDEFSKDGINVLRYAIVSEEPLARLCVRLARFIGSAVDRRCHDGTTTSMLLFALILRRVAEQFADGKSTNRQRLILARDLKDLFLDLVKQMDNLKITPKDLLERATELGIETTDGDVREAIAYHMALIASKGDDDLARKVAKVVRHSPVELSGFYTRKPLRRESAERYILEKQDYDITFPSSMANFNLYNHLNGTQFLDEDALVYVTSNELVTDTFEAEWLAAFITPNPGKKAMLEASRSQYDLAGLQTMLPRKRRLVIIAPMISCRDLQEAISLYNNANKTTPVVPITTNVTPMTRQWFGKTVNYMHGKPVASDTEYDQLENTILGTGEKGIKVQTTLNDTRLSNLYQRDGRTFHPSYYDKDANPLFHKFLGELDRMINTGKEDITMSTMSPADIDTLSLFYRSLICQEVHDIAVGGLAHDNYANNSVFEDAMGSAVSAVADGATLSGYARLRTMLRDEQNTGAQQIFLDSLQKLLSVTMAVESFPDIESKWDYLLVDRDAYLDDSVALAEENYLVHGTLDKAGIEAMLELNPKKQVLIQAWAGYVEQLKRFADILPKYTQSSMLLDMRITDDELLE